METITNDEGEDREMGRTGKGENHFDHQSYRKRTTKISVRENQSQSIRISRNDVARTAVRRPRPATSGGSLRQSLAASRRRLVEIAIERQNLRSRLELLDLQEQNENLNIQENQELLSDWEDNVSAVFPVNNQDANTTN